MFVEYTFNKVCHLNAPVQQKLEPTALAGKRLRLEKLKSVIPDAGMSKQEILGWTQRIEQEDEDDEHAPDFDWMTLEKDWSGFLLFAQHQILSSSTKRRIAFINGRLVPLAMRGDLSMSQTMDIFGLVRMTLPRYVDNPSREAVMHLSEVLVRRDELRGREGGELDASKMGVAEQIIGWLNVEATRISQSPASVASLQISVLFSWACNLYSLIVKLTPGYQATPVWGKLSASIALLLDSILDTSSPAKPALRKRSTVQARRTVLSSPESIPKLAELVCQAISGNNTKGIPFLGLIYDVATHLKLKEGSTELAGKIEASSNTINMAGIDAGAGHSTQDIRGYRPFLQSGRSAAYSTYDGFVENAISQENHESKILPVIEKMLLRSPEICLPTFTAFYTHYKQSLRDEELKRLLTPILSGTKSTNGTVRSGVIDLWLAITPLIISESGFKFSVDNILTPVLTGKTNGVDHRQALFKLIQHIPTGPQSREIIKGLVAQLEKETNESVLTCISEALPKHMVNVLKSGNHLEPSLLSIIGKEVASSKPPNRRAVMVVLGNIFWDAYQDPSAWTPGATELLETIYPTLEKILRDAPSSTMAPGANPVEAWIALVVLLSSPVTSAKSLPFVHSVVVPTGKPSFLYSEKVYQKVTDDVDILWLLRVINRVASAFSEEIVQQPRNELYYGQTLLWLVVDHPSSQVRRLSIETLRNKSGVSTIIYGSIKQAMEQILFDEKKYLGLSDPKHRSSRLSSALISSIPSPGESDLSVEPLFSELLLLSHHRIFAQLADNLWIELLQYAKLDPHGVVTRNFKQLITYAEDAVTGTDSGSLRNDAALRAITTLAFVAPELTVPHLLRKIKTLLDPTPLHALGELEMGVWKTPVGTPFVDVLASSKGNSGKDKGKDADIKKWEAELRKSLAQKKTAEPTLSKQERALIDAQLQKEESIRTSLRDLKKRLLNGVSMISSLLQSGTADSREQSPFLASILMNGIVQRGSLLLGPRVISVFLDLFKSASERLQESRMWFGIATLRVYEVEEIPENLTEEPLNGLLGRLLYKLKGLSDQNPFDGATFSLLWPFIQKVVQKGGIGTESEDDAVEQLVLILDVIRSHTSQFAIPSYPRKDTCQLLVHVIGGHPRVSRDAISALLETGEAIHDSATAEEQDELINSTLNQEVFVRNACLQAMQSFDLTERDWVPILWLACHDEDDQNANLARRLWVENGLDVPDTFLDDMVPFL
ncbi:translational activator of GCN4, partial [Serendipita sp. 405]